MRVKWETQECWLYDNCNHCDCNKEYCIRKDKLDKLYQKALMPNKLRRHITLYPDNDKNHTDLAEFKQLAAIEKDIKSFVQKGNNLYIHSAQCGNGKTSWAIRMLQAYLNKIWPESDIICRVLYIHVPDFMVKLKIAFLIKMKKLTT